MRNPLIPCFLTVGCAMAAVFLISPQGPFFGGKTVVPQEHEAAKVTRESEEYRKAADSSAEDELFFGLFARSFDATIPMKRNDVVEWIIVEGDSLSGVAFDSETGQYEGTPLNLLDTVHVINGHDILGKPVETVKVRIVIASPDQLSIKSSL